MAKSLTPSTDATLAALLGDLITDARTVLVQEFTLAKLEVRDELQKTKTAALLLSIGLGITAVGGLLLILMLVHLLAALTGVPLWAGYGIVGAVFAITGGLLLIKARRTLSAIHVVPEQTVATVQENIQWVTAHTTAPPPAAHQARGAAESEQSRSESERSPAMSTIEKSIDVNVPVRTAYNQWTQFEEFPRFMEGVQAVRQLDDKHLEWRATIGGKEKVWTAEIVEQLPDERVAWRNTSGARNAGVVTFHRLAADKTRVMVQMDYEPEGVMETVGDFLGAMSRRVEEDLARFKEFIEARGQETGAWRGEIPQAAGHATTAPRQAPMRAPAPPAAGGTEEVRVPVVEEELEVGKRAVQREVRVQTHVTETPVEETVPLREERVTVERRPVDRPVSGAEADALTERTIEVRETREEPVVAKQARVVEEVVISKEAQERTETVRDTVRRTDVEVERRGSERGPAGSGFDVYDADFRNNFTATYGPRGKTYTYEHYVPAYRYGYDIASDQRYRGKDWDAVETDVRRDWETRHPGQGAWEDVKDAVRYAWDTVRGRTPRRA